MPSTATLESFIQRVEAGQTLAAMVRCDAEHASMQENGAAPRVGKAALPQHEAQALATIARLQARCVRPVFIADDFAVIRWVFDIPHKAGKWVHFEEWAHQRWEGEQVAEEKFVCDPAPTALTRRRAATEVPLPARHDALAA